MKLDVGTFWRITLAALGLTLLSAVRALEYNWPDFHHIEYGFPFPWLTRVLGTIAGAADYFVFAPSGFVASFAFWFLLTLGSLFLSTFVRRRTKVER